MTPSHVKMKNIHYFIMFIFCIILLLNLSSSIISRGDVSVAYSVNNLTTQSNWKTNSWLCADGELYQTYGASDDPWGLLNLIQSNFTNSTFQVVINASYLQGGVGTKIDVDNVQVRVYYNPLPIVTLVNPTPSNNSIIGSTLRINATTQIDIYSCYLQSNYTGTWTNKTMIVETGQRSCYINPVGLNNNTFSYNVIASTNVLPAGVIGISETRNVSVRNIPSLIDLNYISNNTITTNRSVVLNWSINNTQNDEVIVRGFISQNTTGNISKQMFYYQEGALNNSYIYNFSNMLTPLNSDSLWALYRFENNSDLGENSTNFLDYSKYSRNGTTQSGTIEFRNSKFGRGLYHDSGVFYLKEMIMQSKDFDNVSVNGMSINAWINMTANTSTYSIANLWNSPSDQYFNLQYVANRMEFSISKNGTSASTCTANSSGSGGFDTNRDYMVSATFNGSYIQLYRDGSLIGNKTCSFNGINQTAWNSISQFQYVVVGEVLSDTVSFEGIIDELGFWNKSLSAQEVSDLYNLKNDTYFWYLESNEYNATNSKVNSSLWQFTIGSVVTNSCSYTSGNWNLLCSDNCVISSNVVASSGSNLTITTNGSVIFNANVTGFLNTLFGDVGGNCSVTQNGNFD